jgi:CRP-like cAMP-binding protein
MARTVGRRWPRTLYHAILPAITDLAALAVVPLFTGLDQVRLEGLAARSVVRTVDAGRIVALRGRPATHLIVVERGALTASHSTAGGRRLRLGRFAAPCAVDKAAVLDGGGHTPPPGRRPLGAGCVSYPPTTCWPSSTTSRPHVATCWPTWPAPSETSRTTWHVPTSRT